MEVKLLIFLAGISALPLVSTGLTCDWGWSSGVYIPSVVGSGENKTMDGSANDARCQEACMEESEFLCHSVSYDTRTDVCVLYAEPEMVLSEDSSWRSASRPTCAGVWFAWTSTDGQPHQNVVAIERPRPKDRGTGLEDCVAACMRNVSYEDQGIACQFVSMSRTNGSTCELWSISSPGVDVRYQQTDEFMTFHRPPYYQDGSSSTTDSDVRFYGVGWNPQLFNASLPIPSAGYLIAWQYYYKRLVEPCTSYAAIWSNTWDSRSTFILKNSTELTPSERDDTDGVKFQFVQQVIRVSTNDFAGTHIDIEEYNTGETDGKCSGNRVSFSTGTEIEGNFQLYLSYLQNNLEDGLRVDSSVGLSKVNSASSLKAYIAPYRTISGQPTVSHQEDMEILVEWTPLYDRDIEVAGYRLFCSANADMTDASPCPGDSLVTGNTTTIVTARLAEPRYVAVSVVRNTNGEESRDLLLSKSSVFCSAHERSNLSVTGNYSRISPGAQVEVEFTVAGLENDTCADLVAVKLESLNGSVTRISSDASSKALPQSLNVLEGITYRVSLTITLKDSHTIEVKQLLGGYEAKAPPGPVVKVLSRGNVSATLTWDKIETEMDIAQYEIECDNVGRYQGDNMITMVISITNVTIPLGGPQTSYELAGLQVQNQYQCSITGQGDGGSIKSYSTNIHFWSKPNNVKPVWPAGDPNVSHTESTIAFTLPEPLVMTDRDIFFRELWVRVVRIGSRRRRDVNYDNVVAKMDLADQPETFTVGSGASPENPGLTGGTYTVSIGYRAPSEEEPLSYTIVPGLGGFIITGTVLDAESPAIGGLIGGIVGVIFVLVLIGVIILLVRYWKGFSPFKPCTKNVSSAEAGGSINLNPRANVNTDDVRSPLPQPFPVRSSESVRNVALPSLLPRRMESEHNSQPRPANHDIPTSGETGGTINLNPRANVYTADVRPPLPQPFPVRSPELAHNVALPSLLSRRMESEHNTQPRPANHDVPTSGEAGGTIYLTRRMESEHDSQPRPASHDVPMSSVKRTKAVVPLNSSQHNNTSMNPIPVNMLGEYIADEKNRAVENSDGDSSCYADEFDRLLTRRAPTTAVGRNPGNKRRNRYTDTSPSDDNRVKLQSSATNPSGYINASKISADEALSYKYIATQGPKRVTIPDFWQMVKLEGCKVIIMLCNIMEVGQVKCTQYWPESRDAPLRFDDTQIMMKKEQKCAEFYIRTLMVKTKQGGRYQERTVELFHFTAWPDKGVPTTAGLLSFRHRVKDMMVAHPYTPTIVHCSAGIGRTGTFIALDMILDQVENTEEGSPARTILVDIMGTVNHLRKQRYKMVQTKEQYAFLYDTVAEALTAGNTSILCSVFASVLPELRDRLPDQLHKMNLATQYHSPALSYTTSCLDENQEKNRCNILAGDDVRVLLYDKNFYINGVTVDGYYRKRDFICTQHPLNNTADEFWFMVYEKAPRGIVYFHDLNEEMEFFPAGESVTRNFGGIDVRLTETKEDRDNNLRISVALVSNEKKERRVKLIQWGAFGTSPRSAPSTSGTEPNGIGSATLTPDPDQICKLVQDLEPEDNDNTDKEFKQPLVVTCRDGTRLCGLFVVATNLYQRLCIEQEVDVVLEVKLARRSRPEFVSNIEEFELLHDFIDVFLSQFKNYSNFQQLDKNQGRLMSPADDGLYTSINKPPRPPKPGGLMKH